MGGRSEGLGGLRGGHMRSRCGSQQRLYAACLLCLNCATHEGLLGPGSPLPRSFKHAHPEMRAYKALYGLLMAHWLLSTSNRENGLKTHSRTSQRGAFAFYRLLGGHSAFRGNARALVFSSVQGKQTRSWAQRAQERNYFRMGEAGERGLLEVSCGFCTLLDFIALKCAGSKTPIKGTEKGMKF